MGQGHFGRIVFCCLLFLGATSATASQNLVGQWIWTPQDLRLYQSGQKSIPDLQAAVWAGTVFWDGDHFRYKLALSPAVVTSPVLVIRLDDSVHRAWKETELKSLEELDHQIQEILDHARGTGVHPSIVQLDYDCPVSQLPRWSEALKVLKENSLRDEDVWITSLISHVENAGFGKLFGGLVAGHILQVFDTGDSFSEERPVAILRDLESQGLPFQMGLGSFERKSRSGALTQHREWLRRLPVFSTSPLYRGVWIFPAGQPWIASLKEVLP